MRCKSVRVRRGELDWVGQWRLERWLELVGMWWRDTRESCGEAPVLDTHLCYRLYKHDKGFKLGVYPGQREGGGSPDPVRSVEVVSTLESCRRPRVRAAPGEPVSPPPALPDTTSQSRCSLHLQQPGVIALPIFSNSACNAGCAKIRLPILCHLNLHAGILLSSVRASQAFPSNSTPCGRWHGVRGRRANAHLACLFGFSRITPPAATWIGTEHSIRTRLPGSGQVDRQTAGPVTDC